MMFPREILALFEGGRLSQPSFMYGEDREWCFVIKQAGYKILYYPAARIIHEVAGSEFFSSAREISDRLEDLEYSFVRRHYGRFGAMAFRAVRTASSAVKN